MSSEGALYDVIIAGAGPAGAAAASFLAKRGFKAIAFEREHFPRFHIGESLLPAAVEILNELEIDPDPDFFIFKRGARFVCERTNREQVFAFSEALAGPPRGAYQIERAYFDRALADRARSLGAEVIHGVRVLSMNVEGNEVRVATTEGEHRGRYFIDATGQDRLLARQRRSVKPYRHFGKASVFTHYFDLTDEAIELIGEGNDIRIMMIPDGWAWIIPLAGRKLSVGIVSRKQGLKKEMLDEYFASSPLISQLIKGARRGETRMIGNYSFRNAIPYGARFACLGDSNCFIDPVFSSGVTLALTSAKEMVEVLAAALERGEEDDPELMRASHEATAEGYETFAALVYRFYNTKIVDNIFFNAPDDGSLRPAVTSVLGGNVFYGSNPFKEMLLASKKRPWRDDEEATESFDEGIEAEGII